MAGEVLIHGGRNEFEFSGESIWGDCGGDEGNGVETLRRGCWGWGGGGNIEGGDWWYQKYINMLKYFWWY